MYNLNTIKNCTIQKNEGKKYTFINSKNNIMEGHIQNWTTTRNCCFL